MRAAVLSLAVLSVAAGWQMTSFAQATTDARSAPGYTTAHVALGQIAYRGSCASCHRDTAMRVTWSASQADAPLSAPTERTS